MKFTYLLQTVAITSAKQWAYGASRDTTRCFCSIAKVCDWTLIKKLAVRGGFKGLLLAHVPSIFAETGACPPYFCPGVHSLHDCRAVASLTVPGGQEFHFPHFFLKSRLSFLIFPQTFTHFLPHFGPPGGQVAHPGRPWLRQCMTGYAPACTKSVEKGSFLDIRQRRRLLQKGYIFRC